MASDTSPLVNLSGDLEELQTESEFYIKQEGSGDELKVLNKQDNQILNVIFGHSVTMGIMADSKGPRFKISDMKGNLLWTVAGDPQVDMLGYRSKLALRVMNESGSEMGSYEGDKLCFKIFGPSREQELFKVERGLISHDYKITSKKDESIKGKIKEEFTFTNIKSRLVMPTGISPEQRILILIIAIEATTHYFESNKKNLGK